MKKACFYLLGIVLCFSAFTAVLNAQTTVDSDKDGLSDYDEMNKYFTSPTNYDTDGDGYDDGTEVKNFYSPHHANKRKMIDVDSDNDGLNDKWELAIGTKMIGADSDYDGYGDGTEVRNSYDPLKNKAAKSTKVIDVVLGEQKLYYYFDSKLLESFLISSGIASLPTPRGNFTVLEKVPVKAYGGTGYSYYYPNTKWNLLFKDNGGAGKYYIHGAYWHDKFGQPMSHGCVNVSYANMERLYNWVDTKTKVQIY